MTSFPCFTALLPNSCPKNEEWMQRGDLPNDLLIEIQHALDQCSTITWKPDFGCAILQIVNKNSHAHIQVIGLDEWEQIVRRGEADTFVSTADSNGYRVIPCGQVPKQDYPQVLQDLEDEIQKRLAKIRDKKHLRTAISEGGGIQRTPGFIATLLAKLVNKDTASNFQGGFTDVGLHTDCTLRDTAWKLSCFVVEHLIASQQKFTRQDFKRFLHLFQVHIVVQQANMCRTTDFSLINTTFDMLDKLTWDTANCVNLAKHVSIEFVTEQCEQIRSLLDEAVHIRGEALIKERAIGSSAFGGEWTDPSMDIDVLVSEEVDTVDHDMLAKREFTQIPCSSLDAMRSFSPCQISNMLSLAKHFQAMDLPREVFLNELDVCFQRIAQKYLVGGCADGNVLDKTHLTDLDQLVELYRVELSTHLKELAGSIGALEVDYHSREALIVWLLYCMAHKICWRESVEFQHFAVSLQFQDLAHLHVADVGFQTMLTTVHAYLAQPCFSSLPRRVFAGENADIMEFAASYALKDAGMIDKWELFDRESNHAINEHWKTIEGKKKLIHQLEEERDKLQRDYNSLLASQEQTGSTLMGQTYTTWRDASNEVNRIIQSQISAKTGQIYKADRDVPTAVTMCLPSTKEEAAPVLFFLYMPNEFRILSRASFLAQQMLYDRNANDGTTHLVVQWHEFVTQTSVKLNYPTHGELKFGSRCDMRKKSPPSTVREHYSKDDGIFYPDELNMETAWYGGRNGLLDGSSAPFNPFLATSCNTSMRYTPILEKELRWALRLDAIGGVEKHRGNIALAAPDQRPSFLSREQYKAFSCVRSQPLLQYQELCSKLHDDTLPFEESSVRVLIKHMLGHIGPIVNGNTFLWRTLAETEDGLETILHELKSKADMLKESPSNLMQVLLFGQIASFYSQFSHVGCRTLAKEFASIVETWAHGLEVEVEEVLDKPELLCNVRSRQATMFGTSLTFYRYVGDLQQNDVEHMCRLFVLFTNKCPFAAAKSELVLISQLKRVCREVMVHHRIAIQRAISQTPQLLSSVVGAVINDFPQLPWQRWNSNAGVYTLQMENAYNVHVDVLFSGKVLVNGRPLTGLPSLILNHSLFKKTFGKRDFDVSTLANGASATTFPVDGFYYSFQIIGKRLLTKEWTCENDCKILLDDVACGELLGLPPRLLELCSIWRCEMPPAETETVSLFRGIEFSARSVQFIHVNNQVFEVPEFRSNDIWLGLVQSVQHGKFRRLVYGSNSITKSLGCFEPEQFIHTFVSLDDDSNQLPPGSVVYHLPRYDISFVTLPGDDHNVLPKSKTWRDACWRLHETQTLGDTLLGLKQCIVLSSTDTVSGKRSFRLIVAKGLVQRDTSNQARIQVSSAPDAKLGYFSFDRQLRDGHLFAKTLPARLQLAALYSVCTLGFDSFSNQRGYELAVELLRQCFPVQLCAQDLATLDNISILGKRDCPAIHLLCVFLAKWNSDLGFLSSFGKQQQQRDETVLPNLLLDQAAAMFYCQCANRAFGGMRPRTPLLRDSEHRFLFGTVALDGNAPAVTTPMNLLMVMHMELDASFVDNAEQQLVALVTSSSKQVSTFPIKLDESTAAQGRPFIKMMRDELEQSYKTYAQEQDKTVDVNKAHQVAMRLLQITGENIASIKTWLQDVLWEFLPTHTNHMCVRRLDKASGNARKPSWRDFLRLVFVPDFAHELNPFLSEQACRKVVSAAIELLKLCVLEDKLNRIQRLNSAALVIKELECKRVWNVCKYPEWLVFEAEQGLQVRPDQAHVALSILSNPGKVLQLQVGEGKTRVILPLVILASLCASSQQEAKMMRLNFLSDLHSEATAYFANTLSTSMLSRPVFTLPFCRDVQFSGKVNVLDSVVDMIRDTQGFLSVSPQHTMSMSLKLEEMHGVQGDFAALLQRIDQGFVDVFDESDEHMHPRTQLVYAVGEKTRLPFHEQRLEMIQSLFLCVQKREGELDALLTDEQLVASFDLTLPENTTLPYRAVQLRSVIEGDQGEHVLKTKQHKLIVALAAQVLRAISWFAKMPLTRRNTLLDLVVNLNEDANAVMDSMGLENEQFRTCILALRGLLGHGLFLFCLTRRPRVEFGIRRPFIAGINKRVAVPFRANNTPAPRAEYSQPDCALVWTHMAYYNDGLSFSECDDAINWLLYMGPNERQEEFDKWLVFSQHSTVRDARQIDMSNKIQLEYLRTTFSRNMNTIHFWLRRILAQDMVQYPEELVRNAWHLAGKGTCRGISGTNFNYHLLPQQITQVLDFPQAPSIAATNGKMLDLISKTVIGVEDAFPANIEGEFKWQRLVKRWFESGYAALIDAGALATGVKNSQLAQFAVELLRKTPSAAWRGVVYFCVDNEDWYVNERSGPCVPLVLSSVQANEALVYFDDCRCRGADLKLKPDAVGMVTLSMGITLSKLIQAVGRLRQLGHNQTVVLAAPHSVLNAMKRTNDVCLVDDVLQFTFINVVSEIVTNVPQWVSRGCDFALDVTRREIDISLNVYAEKSRIVKLDEMIESKAIAVEGNLVAQSIIQHGIQLGKGFSGKSSRIGGAEDECERETEQEQEEEQEVERELPSAKLRAEKDWDIAMLLFCESANKIDSSAPVALLCKMLPESKLISSKVSEIPWPLGLYCTKNFLHGVEEGALVDSYVRMANNLVAFTDGTLLMITEREANTLCDALWQRKASPVIVSLIRASFLKDELETERLVVGCKNSPLSSNKAFQNAMAFVQLFNGDCKYSERRIQVLCPFLLPHRVGIYTILDTIRNRISEYLGSKLCAKRNELEEEEELRGLK